MVGLMEGQRLVSLARGGVRLAIRGMRCPALADWYAARAPWYLLGCVATFLGSMRGQMPCAASK